jgi:hypothetical protein
MPLDNYLLVAGLAAVVVALTGLGVFIGFQTGRRSFRNSIDHADGGERRPAQMPAQLLRELQDCLNLADCVVRDTDALSTAVQPERTASREPDQALKQLRRAAKVLASRLEQVCVEGPAAIVAETPEPASEKIESATQPAPEPAAKPVAELTRPQISEVSQQRQMMPEDLRKHERRPCPGTLKATIYPPPDSPGGEPVQCTVITRDLSCGGIGIAHTEQLYPRQIIVLHAVTRVLVGEVRWCQQIGERYYIAGCQLVKAGG